MKGGISFAQPDVVSGRRSDKRYNKLRLGLTMSPFLRRDLLGYYDAASAELGCEHWHLKLGVVAIVM